MRNTKMDKFIKIFKALSDKNRVRIVKMLEGKELCVCEITEILNLAPSTVSKHLSILKDANLILDTKVGKWVNFKLNDELMQDTSLVEISSILEYIRINMNEDKIVQNDKHVVESVNRNLICNIN